MVSSLASQEPSAAATFRPTFERRDERGVFTEILRRGPWHTVITAKMRRGAVLGHHYHRRTRMALYLLSGRATARIVNVASADRCDVELTSGHGVYLEAGEAHVICFNEDSQCLLLKSEPYDPADADTIAYAVEDA